MLLKIGMINLCSVVKIKNYKNITFKDNWVKIWRKYNGKENAIFGFATSNKFLEKPND